ncbi:hypothetical protein EJV44_14115 [Ancylobacter aquaticus]|nr:hypothetical protein EJV44_14115 [Ancylobacter aquaticus]
MHCRRDGGGRRARQSGVAEVPRAGPRLGAPASPPLVRGTTLFPRQAARSAAPSREPAQETSAIAVFGNVRLQRFFLPPERGSCPVRLKNAGPYSAASR